MNIFKIKGFSLLFLLVLKGAYIYELCLIVNRKCANNKKKKTKTLYYERKIEII
jgi:hypothetical protein